MPQNCLLHLSGAMSKVAITFDLLEVQQQGAASRAPLKSRLQLNGGVLSNAALRSSMMLRNQPCALWVSARRCLRIGRGRLACDAVPRSAPPAA